ncbi:hypothetical protein EV426DRAFT_705359 [Tirmania nivea]|nr:hypothetical protein EV426DRAFT_705359 [Tirmania nivea]
MDEILPLPRVPQRRLQQTQGSELNRDQTVERGEKECCERGGQMGEQRDRANLDEHWFSSTGCPLIAATLGPVANLLSVCALIDGFRVSATNRADHESDPHWAYAINGLSLFLGLAANIALLLTLFRLAPYRLLQPFTAICWLLSALLLLTLIIVFIHAPTLNPHSLNSSPLPPGPEAPRRLTWSQSYYYAILSSTIYLVITLLLGINLYSAYIQKRFRAGLRGLTNPQRTLILLSTAYMVYLSLGALAFAHIEEWRFLDAVYWADVTLLSIGIGSDFAPRTTSGRVFVVFYAWGGLVMLGLLILGVRKLLVEKAKGKMRLATVRKGKKIVKWVARRKWKGRMKGGRGGVQRVLDRCEKGDGDGGDEMQHPVTRERREKTKKVNKKATWWIKWLGLAYAFTAFLLLCFGGAAVFWYFESEQRWSYGDSLYFTNIALLTIGYGDFYPTSEGGKPVFVLWSLLAVPTVTTLISSLQDVSFDRLRKAAERKRVR